MPFSVLYYHIVWATHERLSLITPYVEPIIFDAIRHKSAEFNSSIHALNRTADHIHIAVSIAPSIAVAEWIKSIKGRSSYIV